MSDGCEHCTRARSSPPYTSGAYDDGCDGCVARGLARSLAMFKAIRQSDANDLQDALARLFPNLAYRDARKIVWDWFQHDHPEEVSTEGTQ